MSWRYKTGSRSCGRCWLRMGLMDTSALRALAERFQVERLELFGSAARGAPHPGDHDFLVTFRPLDPLEHGRMYFSLLQGLEETLGGKVDLIELGAVNNPYFLKAIEGERVLIYAA